MLISFATSLTFLPPCSSDITLVQSTFLAAAYAFAEPSSKPIVTTNRNAATTGRSFFVTVVLLLEKIAKFSELFQKPELPKRAAMLVMHRFRRGTRRFVRR
jgi:hypothetical protein